MSIFKIKGRRGEAIARTPFISHFEPLPMQDIRPKVKDEYNLLLAGDFNKLKTWKIWDRDEDLLAEYITFFNDIKEQLIKPNLLKTLNRQSRNNVVVNRACCISWVQVIGDYLYVVSRSSDELAEQWDRETISLLAHHLDAKEVFWVNLHSHKYLNPGINRRPKGEQK